MTGAVSGTPVEEKSKSDLSVRRFLLSLHLSHS